MKLSKKQYDVLQLLKEEKAISKDNSKIHNNILNALYFKGLIHLVKCANGDFWELTDNGLSTIIEYKNFNDY